MTSQKGGWNTFSINCILEPCNLGALHPSYKIRTASGIFYNTPMPGPHLQKVSLIGPGEGMDLGSQAPQVVLRCS